MGFLDKLLGRKKDDEDGAQNVAPEASAPESDTGASSPGEGEHDHGHSHEGHDHEH